MGLRAAESAAAGRAADDARLARPLRDFSTEQLLDSVATAEGQPAAGPEAGIVHGAGRRSRCDLAANHEADTRVHFLGDLDAPLDWILGIVGAAGAGARTGCLRSRR